MASKAIVVSLLGLGALSASASGEVIGNAISVRVDTPGGSGVWSLPVSAAPIIDGVWTWGATNPIAIRSSTGELLATIDDLDMQYVVDPQINLNFVFTAASSATKFTISSGLLSFATIDAEARASATMTATDNNGDGVSVTGSHGIGSKAYRANYNGAIPGPTQFAALVNNFGASAFDTGGGSETVGFSPIGFTSSMAAEFSFTLSGGDSASGTSTYITRVIPAPGVLALMGLGAAAVTRRRR